MPDENAPDEPITRAPGPKPRWGYDADGNEIQPPATGLEIDPETGRAVIPKASAPETAPAPKASTTTKSS